MTITYRRPLFILAGNGPYQNRGCEAIVRGKIRTLGQHFKETGSYALVTIILKGGLKSRGAI